jgi:hypothetical protein
MMLTMRHLKEPACEVVVEGVTGLVGRNRNMSAPGRRKLEMSMKGNFVPLIVALVAVLAVVFLATGYFDTSNTPSRMSEAPSGSAPATK